MVAASIVISVVREMTMHACVWWRLSGLRSRCIQLALALAALLLASRLLALSVLVGLAPFSATSMV